MTLSGSVRRKCKHLIGLAAQLALWLALTLAFLHLPEAPPMDPELDGSWELCVPYMFHHGMQFGTDVVFTYGPLGFLISRVYCGAGLWLQFTAMVAAAGMFAWILMVSIRPLKWPARIIAALAVLLLISQRSQELYLLMITFLGLQLLLRDEPRDKVRTALACIILGFLSLTKFTNFMLAAAAVIIAAGYYFLGKKWSRGVLIATGFAVAIIGWWLLCGQSISSAGPCILNSLELSKGYEATMFIDEKAREKFMGVALVLLLAAYGAFEAAATRQRVKGFAVVLIFWAATYLTWKHSFIRAADAHIFGLYFWALAVALLYPVFFPYRERWRYARVGFLVAIGLFAIGGFYRLDPNALTRCIPEINGRFRRNFDAFTNLPGFKRDLDSRYAAVASNNAAPRIVQAVGRGSVDVFGFQQRVAIFNGLNYTPRPVFQSYFVYTPKLARLNAAFMTGEKAPEWILQRYEYFDHRYPSTDDGLALRVLLDRYTFQFQDSGYTVWRRTQGKGFTTLPPPVREGDSTFDQDIPVGDIAANASLWLEVVYSYTVAGSLRELLYKPPMVNLMVTTADQPDSPMKFRFPGLIAREGMLLSPYLPDEYDFLRYAAGMGGPKVQSFKLKYSRENARYLKRTFHYRLTALPDPYNLPINRTMADRIRRYPMFDVIPSRVEASAPPHSVGLGGREMLEVRAPSRIEFPIPPGVHRVLGGFGLKTDAPTADAVNTDKRPSADFQVLLREGTAERILFDRQLNPHEVPGDQGLQPLEVALPASAPGSTLVLNAISKSSKENGGDLTCWTGIRIQ